VDDVSVIVAVCCTRDQKCCDRWKNNAGQISAQFYSIDDTGQLVVTPLSSSRLATLIVRGTGACFIAVTSSLAC